jgi:hypothetical protein
MILQSLHSNVFWHDSAIFTEYVLSLKQFVKNCINL